jgi:hypothetical protein
LRLGSDGHGESRVESIYSEFAQKLDLFPDIGYEITKFVSHEIEICNGRLRVTLVLRSSADF